MRKTTVKTSHTHPLRIDWVTPDNVPGKIGMTFCPGKKVINAISGGDWDRDLDIDLGTIVDSGTLVLVTLIEDHEFEEMRVTALSQTAKAYGLSWYHLPILDKGVPYNDFEEKWSQAGSDLRTHLFTGDNIVIHCKGGQGRTGLVTARLLIELDEKTESAVKKVRDARPGTIETKEQESFVINIKSVTRY